MTTSTEENGRSGRPSLPTTPLFAVVGATDLALQQVRAAAAGAASVQQRFQSDIEARLAGVNERVGPLYRRTLRAQAEQAPTLAVTRALEVKVRAEAAYEELARRGKDLFDRVSTQPETQTFRTQAESTLNRGRAAASAIRGTLGGSRTEPVEVTEPAADTAPKLNIDAVQQAVAVGDGGDKAVTRPRARKAPAARKSTAATKNAAPDARRATGPRAAKKITD